MGEQVQDLELNKKQCNKEKQKNSKYKGFFSFLEDWGSIGSPESLNIIPTFPYGNLGVV